MHDIKIASLIPTAALEDYALKCFRENAVEVFRCREMDELQAALRREHFDGLLLHDDERELSYCLAALKLSCSEDIPVIVFGRGSGESMALALQQGADEYCFHAEGPAALLQRMQARVQQRVQRRTVQQHRKRLQAGVCMLDAESRSLSAAEREVSLTAREFALAWALFMNPGRVVSFNRLSQEIWSRSSDICKRTIEQHVYKLRRKIVGTVGAQRCPGVPCIEAVYGVGYRLHVAAAVEPNEFSAKN
jgi:DNA-binding response OmpR family regulator